MSLLSLEAQKNPKITLRRSQSGRIPVRSMGVMYGGPRLVWVSMAGRILPPAFELPMDAMRPACSGTPVLVGGVGQHQALRAGAKGWARSRGLLKEGSPLALLGRVSRGSSLWPRSSRALPKRGCLYQDCGGPAG